MSKKATAKKATKPAAKTERPTQPTKNGITEPRVGGKTRAIWDICDALSKKLGRTPTRGEVLESAPKGSKPNMVATQYGYWRRFHGITGRISAPKPAATAKPAKSAKTAKAKPAKAPKAPVPPKAPAAPKPPVPPSTAAAVAAAAGK